MMGTTKTKTLRALAISLAVLILFNFMFFNPVLSNRFDQNHGITMMTVASDTLEQKHLEKIPEKPDTTKTNEKGSKAKIAYNFIFYAIYLYFNTLKSYPSR